MEQMKKDKVLELANICETAPGFFYGSWGHCIVGQAIRHWATADDIRDIREGYDTETQFIKRTLGLTGAQAVALGLTKFEDNTRWPTREESVDMLRRLAETGEVKWVEAA